MHHLPESTPVARFIPQAEVGSFASANLHKNPNLYPGERPADSYVTDGENIFDIQVTPTENGALVFNLSHENGEIDLDEYLKAQGVPTMEERIPVLAFGGNMSPGNLKTKFTKVGRPDAQIVPTIYGELPEHDVVWSGGPGVNGNFIAILYSGKETQGTTVQVGVSFLTREQLLVMHATELAYDLSAVTVNVADQKVKAYYYAGMDSVYSQDDHPVAIESIAATGRTLRSASTDMLLSELVSDKALLGQLYNEHPDLARMETSEEYIAYAKELLPVRGKGARLALKKQVHAILAEEGRSKIVTSVDNVQNLASWANPSTLATYGEQTRGSDQHNDTYVLPSQEIPKGSWPDELARARVLRAVSTHLVRISDGELQDAPETTL